MEVKSGAFTLEVEEDNLRIDVYLSSHLGISRSAAKRLIEGGFVTLSGSIPKPSKKVKRGDLIKGYIPPPEPIELKPQDLPIEIIYEDDDIAVIYKPSGIVVHPSPGHPKDTVVNALLYHLSSLSQDSLRPGIVHRLDGDTSGLMVVAKNDRAHKILADEFKERKVEKVYRAVVWGRIEGEGVLDFPIGRHPRDRKKMAVVNGGREAVTIYKPIKTSEDFSYIEVRIKTGRTHQIRVHMSHIGHPIVGDRIYGKKSDNTDRLMLHAFKLSFYHPRSGSYISFEREEPMDFRLFLKEKGLL